MNKRKNKKPDYLKQWRGWRYKNTTLLVLGMALFVYLAQTPFVDNLIKEAGTYGYAGAFIAGIFFVSTFTAVPAGFVLYNLADHLQPIEVALMAALGAMLGDYLILRLLKDNVFEELQPLLGKLGHPYIRTLFKTPYFAWLMPVIGAAIIASPLPDEAGVSILGLTKMRRWQFFTITYVLNAVGIFAIVSAAKL